MSELDKEDLQKNMGVLVAFTIAKYSTKVQKDRGLPPGCSLNIKEMIILSKPAHYHDLVDEFGDPEEAGLDTSNLVPVTSFYKASAGPSKKEVDERQKIADEAEAEIRAIKMRK